MVFFQFIHSYKHKIYSFDGPGTDSNLDAIGGISS